jgi:glycerol-3-phosphate O-acyltransferase
MIRFFWKIFKSENGITVRIGQPLDVFGNTVDHDGNSLAASSDQNPIKINPLQWIRSHGEYSVEPQRDAEYTRQLGHHLVNRFHCEHVVLSSQLIAFTYFEMLRKQYPHYDLFKLLRLSREKSTLPYSDFKKELLKQCLGWEHLSSQNMIQLEETIHRAAQENAVSDEWVLEGIRQLGYLHDHPVIKLNQDHLETEDMNLLYYYRNRLSGYGMSLLGDQQLKFKGKIDEKGFLE